MEITNDKQLLNQFDLIFNLRDSEKYEDALKELLVIRKYLSSIDENEMTEEQAKSFMRKINLTLTFEKTIKDLIGKKSNKRGFSRISGMTTFKDLIKKQVIWPLQEGKTSFKKLNLEDDGTDAYLLYGLPGTGKTMFVRAIAEEIGADLISYSVAEIEDMYYGQSAKKIKEIFDKAKKSKKVVIFFDEFDHFGKSNDQADSNAQSSVKNQLLTEINDFLNERTNDVRLLFAATNKPGSIDQRLLRAGRFNKHIKVPLPDKDARKAIVDSKFKEIIFENDTSIQDIYDSMEEGYTPADIVALCRAIKQEAFYRNHLDTNPKIFKNDIKKAKTKFQVIDQTDTKREIDEFELINKGSSL
jgi:transitional endoplasmic reticulum ATPase